MQTISDEWTKLFHVEIVDQIIANDASQIPEGK